VKLIPVRVGIQQRVLAAYRVPFFDALASACSQGLSVFAGQSRPSENIETCAKLQKARFTAARNLHLLKGSVYLCWQSGFIRWLRSWQPGVLLAEANPRYLHTPDALRWMHHRRNKVIGWGLGAPGSSGEIRSVWRRRFVHQFDAIITYSHQGAYEYVQLGVPEKNIFIACNAVTPRPQHPPPYRSENVPGRPTILFVGRLQARKRLDLLLRACANLSHELQPHLLIVGDGPERSYLERLAKEIYPLTEFTGTRYGVELEDIFRKADLFVLPGTGGLAVQQAMSFALPVIVAEADGTGADLARPQNGWQVQPGSLESLISTLQKALSDINRLRSMGQASFQIIADEINLENMVAVFTDAILSVMEG
jgi:glycosyltransferase involved in cell wall biosynthesis